MTILSFHLNLHARIVRVNKTIFTSKSTSICSGAGSSDEPANAVVDWLLTISFVGGSGTGTMLDKAFNDMQPSGLTFPNGFKQVSFKRTQG
jgi:hypothetical protein